MKNLLRTLVVATFATITNFATANNTEQTILYGDTVTENNTSVVDSMSQRLEKMENYIAQKDKEEKQSKVWKRNKYWKIGMAFPDVKRTDGESMDWKTEFSVFVQRGRTSYLHKKPLAGMIKFGIDWGFFDINYSKLKLKSVSTGISKTTRATSASEDGFDDIVTDGPTNGGMLSAMGVNLGMHKIDESFHVGPSVSVNPWNKLIATAYFHVRPTASFIIQNDCFSYGFGCATAAGVSVAYKAISVGVEGLWGSVKYTQTSFGDDDDDSDEDSASLFDTKKFKLKQSNVRVYLAFRL